MIVLMIFLRVDVIEELANSVLVNMCFSDPLKFVLVNSANIHNDKVHKTHLVTHTHAKKS